MKLFNSIFFILLICSCQTKPQKEKLQRLVILTAAIAKSEFCASSTPENSSAVSTEIRSLLSDMGYDCCSIYYESNEELEDSVLVLTKRKTMEVQTLYYDFAKRERALKTWNYPNASDKRVKLQDRIYLQTSGFD